MWDLSRLNNFRIKGKVFQTRGYLPSKVSWWVFDVHQHLSATYCPQTTWRGSTEEEGSESCSLCPTQRAISAFVQSLTGKPPLPPVSRQSIFLKWHISFVTRDFLNMAEENQLWWAPIQPFSVSLFFFFSCFHQNFSRLLRLKYLSEKCICTDQSIFGESARQTCLPPDLSQWSFDWPIHRSPSPAASAKQQVPSLVFPASAQATAKLTVL